MQDEKHKNDYSIELIDPSRLVGEGITDAQLWAKSFMGQIDAGHFSKEDIDEGLMISWFANAIVTAEDNFARKHGN